MLIGERRSPGWFAVSTAALLDATATTFTTDGHLRTGDLTRMRPDGNPTFVGRTLGMFKSGGSNVCPREVELVLEALPEVTGAAVVPVGDELYGEVGPAYFRPEGTPP